MPVEDLLPEFLTETLENLEKLDTELVQLERQPDDKPTLSSIFRTMHTIKGTCGFLGLARLEKVAHAAESVLDKHRDGSIPVTPASITLILRATDCVRAIVDGIAATSAEPQGDDSALITELLAAAEGRFAAAEVEAEAEEATAAPEPAAAPAPQPEAVAKKPAKASAKQAAGAKQTPAAPAAEAPPPAAAVVPEKKAGEPAAPAGEAVAQTIRVNVDVLEGLMTLVSELVLTRNQILQLARTQDNTTFAAPLQRLSHITSDLQEGVMKTRMQPIGNAWNTLPRLVRDLARELNKKIELVMLGADTELDRQVLELIKDPLTHMVRNSADHGLEDPAGRRAAGKPESGRITLNAYHDGGHIVIEISDDGRGLPVDKIRAKAIANGLATEAELASMADREILAFIFRAGFSTAAAVTSVSGRGVGMDVVKTNIERIGGTVDVSSKLGSGTVFTVKIPLTLAIVSALIVEVGGERYAMPQISVLELVRARSSTAAAGDAAGGNADKVIEQINDTPVLRLRDHLLPLVDLSELLGLKRSGRGSGAIADSLYIIVVQVGASRFGLIVERVFDTEEIVVKPVAPILRHVPLFSGNTILGDGSVIMILDPNGIARATGIGAGHASASTEAKPVVTSGGQNSSQKLALLLFKMGDEHTKAVPLNLVSRLETVERKAIEFSGELPVMQYRGRLMPLVGLPGALASRSKEGSQPVLVFADGERVMGLLVDEIIDVVDDMLKMELGTDHIGFLGTAVIQGRATEVLDTGYWLQQAFRDWFAGRAAGRASAKQLLVVEDSPFFRSLIIPALAAQGHEVTAVDNPVAALAMRSAGRSFDLILSDIEMPEMDGLAFAREVRSGGAWAKLPIIALTSATSPHAVAAGREAGFDTYISKFDKNVLVAAVTEALSTTRSHADAAVA
jgi:two-component system chemotaxis sensor kinase CheA